MGPTRPVIYRKGLFIHISWAPSDPSHMKEISSFIKKKQKKPSMFTYRSMVYSKVLLSFRCCTAKAYLRPAAWKPTNVKETKVDNCFALYVKEIQNLSTFIYFASVTLLYAFIHLAMGFQHCHLHSASLWQLQSWLRIGSHSSSIPTYPLHPHPEACCLCFWPFQSQNSWH